MNQDTLLLRQVHPIWIQKGHMTSQIFRPTPKDKKQLSVYDGDLIQPQDAWEHFTVNLGFSSVGVLGVSVSECQALDLNTKSDPEPFPEHALISFENISESQIKTKAKTLRLRAEERNWLYQVESFTQNDG